MPVGRPRHRRVRTPGIQQMEATECGAASLGIVLAHHGRYVPLEELRAACGVSRDGARASSLLKAARGYGLTAQGLRMEPDRLAATAAPVVLFWEFNHFLVYEGCGRRFGRQLVHLNDPARGHRTVTAAEFDEGFTGLVLTMRPGPGFRPGGRRPGPFAGLAARLRGSRALLALGALCALLLTVTGTALPVFHRAFVDTALSGDGRVPPLFFAAMAGSVLAGIALTALRQSFLLRVRLVSATVNSARFLRHVLRVPLAFLAQRSAADLSRRMASHEELALTLSTDLSGVVINGLAVVVYAVLMCAYSTWLAVLTIGLSLVNVAAVRLVARARADRVSRLATEETLLFAHSLHTLGSIETVKATGAEAPSFRRWAGRLAKVVSGRQQADAPSARLMALAPVVTGVTGSLILLIGGLQAAAGQVTIGLLVAFQVLATAFSGPVAQLTAASGRVQDFTVRLARLRDVENSPARTPTALAPGEPPRRLDGRLAVEGLTFGYDPTAPPLLRDVSFSVGPGQQVALVGASGSGKSTVAGLVAGLHRPWQGTVTLDGVDRERTAAAVLAASVAFVDQDIVLFEGTVRDNITLWDPGISDEEVVAALRDAAVYDVVSAREGGIHAAVAEAGRNFSGGERQRLEIARALVRDPRLLVLDEATSALDAETEAAVTDAVRRRGCAIVVVAHRLSTVRLSEEILVLRQGRIHERGTHTDLLAANGLYAHLVKAG
ncbi:NHLP family bacteriocin export ABC transporter peptidase/permease/ATPase subunit [Streptomyces palmae]|uniref:NHLP family bacteriocin export ABC transporter peptidase/permease/ATPase subunit n=1 Tax=Streptomyces palmae TaxID=1701085 RepID=A0A4Z0H921_9ACTN|nr:NHLP family bacteriocin export ABC transporter peptidase/permease/ATPase subunit [Streptomyces palmae]TGB10109.1 NHLP family bacteriocin export ABC transporter peptidase/permease/ATPase subunit [Streptomyces palmae]